MTAKKGAGGPKKNKDSMKKAARFDINVLTALLQTKNKSCSNSPENKN